MKALLAATLLVGPLAFYVVFVFCTKTMNPQL